MIAISVANNLSRVANNLSRSEFLFANNLSQKYLVCKPERLSLQTATSTTMTKTKCKQLLMILGSQQLPAHVVCSSCLYATAEGQPRWRNGKLRCGIPVQLPGAKEIEFHCIAGGQVVEPPDDSKAAT